jgi:hypothetical protein
LRLEGGTLGRVKRQVFIEWKDTSYVYKKYKDLKNRKAGNSLELRLSHRPSHLVLIKRNILKGGDFNFVSTSGIEQNHSHFFLIFVFHLIDLLILIAKR